MSDLADDLVDLPYDDLLLARAHVELLLERSADEVARLEDRDDGAYDHAAGRAEALADVLAELDGRAPAELLIDVRRRARIRRRAAEAAGQGVEELELDLEGLDA